MFLLLSDIIIFFKLYAYCNKELIYQKTLTNALRTEIQSFSLQHMDMTYANHVKLNESFASHLNQCPLVVVPTFHSACTQWTRAKLLQSTRISAFIVSHVTNTMHNTKTCMHGYLFFIFYALQCLCQGEH